MQKCILSEENKEDEAVINLQNSTKTVSDSKNDGQTTSSSVYWKERSQPWGPNQMKKIDKFSPLFKNNIFDLISFPYRPKVKIKIDGGFMYTIATPFFSEISTILRRYTWEVGKRRAAESVNGNLIDVKVSKYGVEIVNNI